MPFPTFAKQDEIPEPFRAEYEERDGAWHPKAGDDPAPELRTALQKERDRAKTAEKAAKVADEARAELERKLLATGTGDEKIAKALEKFDGDLAKAKAESKLELDKATGELRALKLTDKVKAAMLAAGVLPTRVDAAYRLNEHRFDLEGDRIVVKDAKGDVTSATIDEFAGKEFKAEMPEWFQGTKANGGGAQGGARGGSAKTGLTIDEMLKDPMGTLRAANEAAAA